MTNFPLVSICIPTFNAADTIKEMLDSVLSQTYPNLIVHISDNASTDNTLKIIETINSPRVNIYKNAANIGGEGNFNRCIQLSEGKYTAIFHADDIYESDIVERQVQFLETFPEAGAVFTEAGLINENGDRIGSTQFPFKLLREGELFDFLTIFKAVLKHSNFLLCPSAMVRTNIYKSEIIIWRSDLYKSSADLDVWLRIAQSHKVALLPLPLMRYRISSFQFSANVRRQQNGSDFFLVTKDYLSRDHVSRSLSAHDFENHARLVRRDLLMVSINSILHGNFIQARLTISSLVFYEILTSTFSDKRSFCVLLGWIYLKFMLTIRFYKMTQLSLRIIIKYFNI